MKRRYTVREKANEYTENELLKAINLKEQMIDSFQIDGLNKKSAPWNELPEYALESAENRFKSSLIKLENLKRMLNYKLEMQTIREKHPNFSEDKAYFLWSFTKNDSELFLDHN